MNQPRSACDGYYTITPVAQNKVTRQWWLVAALTTCAAVAYTGPYLTATGSLYAQVATPFPTITQSINSFTTPKSTRPLHGLHSTTPSLQVDTAQTIATNDKSPFPSHWTLSGGIGLGALLAASMSIAVTVFTRVTQRIPETCTMLSVTAEQEPVKPVKKPSKPRLPALDSIRFFLIIYIVCGHFIQTCVSTPALLKLFTQVNVVVGAFFVLSGYVAGYTGSLVGKQEADPRLAPASTYIIGKIMSYYPLHLLILFLFSPMFFYADNYYNGIYKAIAHGLMSLTLTQAWFPLHAEVWNAPTWFLSAMSFAMVAMPSSIAAISQLNMKGLQWAMVALSTALFLPRLAYSYELNVWSVMEGLLNARTHPDISYWNSIRFNPCYALLEMLIGVVACRIVMLDTDEDRQEQAARPHFLTSAVWPLVGMCLVLGLRAFDIIGLNDALTRSLLFIPLFTRFLVNAHRQTLQDEPTKPSITRALAWGPLTYLGTISFPIFVLHGPLGQLLYKKVIASMFPWHVYNSQVWFFLLYLALTVAGGALLHWAFLSRRWVANATKSATKSLCAVFE